MIKRDPIDAFVVFDDHDGDRAASLCRALRKAGLRVFSEHDLKAGDHWDEVLPERLRAARAVVILISERWGSAGGQGPSWYGPEKVAIAIAQARKIEPPPRLIPILLDGAADRIPYGLLRVRAVQVAGEAFIGAATEIAAVLDPTDADAPARPRDAVEAARKRLENLRQGGASEATIHQAEADLRDAGRETRDEVAPREGEVFIGRYLLLERLGDGGFATVWLAQDQRSGQRVAVKVLHGRWRHDQGRIERFVRGAERMASLDHPAVVRVLERPASHEGWHHYVMEYLPGGDLAAARTRVEAPLTADEAIAAVLTVADALAVAHRRGMVHRDVKPQNILLDASGQAKVSDFDLVGADDSTGGTRTGALGTFLFAAPEALGLARDATPAADVYGLAVTTVFALLGRVPAEVVRRPEGVVDELAVPAAVKALLLRSLAWEPKARPADAGEFAAALRRAQGGEPRRWLAPVWIGAVAAVVIVAVAAWLWPKQVPAPPPGFVRVPAGTFMMGSPADEEGRDDDERQHRVTLTGPLWVAAHEVTQREWRALMKTAPSFHAGCDDCPVERVNWFEAIEYANRRSRAEGLDECYALARCGPGEPGGGCPDKDGKPAWYCTEGTWQCKDVRFAGKHCLGYRLPTEAEWEYFARAGTTTRFWSGDGTVDLDRVGWFDGNSGDESQPVGGKVANPWGLFDVAGNVWEWCGDGQGAYVAEAVIDPVGPPSERARVFRGGAFYGTAAKARSANRDGWRPGYRDHSLGFRLVRAPGAP